MCFYVLGVVCFVGCDLFDYWGVCGNICYWESANWVLLVLPKCGNCSYAVEQWGLCSKFPGKYGFWVLFFWWFCVGFGIRFEFYFYGGLIVLILWECCGNCVDVFVCMRICMLCCLWFDWLLRCLWKYLLLRISKLGTISITQMWVLLSSEGYVQPPQVNVVFVFDDFGFDLLGMLLYGFRKDLILFAWVLIVLML